MERLKLLFIISERNKEKNIIDSLSDYTGAFAHSVFGKGTAKSDILSVLGIGETEKALMLFSISEDKIPSVYDILRVNYHFGEPGRGIAFTVPMSAVGGPATLKILTGDFITTVGGRKNG